ncbi:penicillin acylase family protein [Streptomyces sp. NRRL WC-3744]|uniref:penicillin acylase family protein n=1 Tax=Streptomyces sp. NRRL WC-3744 TaxID=1463935 RepID=UPI000A67B6CF
MTIETYRDGWGIPHLRASSARELARAQGRVTAHDRAWQLEVERHRFQGTSASFLGAEALSWDVFARRARLDDTARRCFAALERRDPETADWVRAYVDGVNEGLPAGAARAPEFARAGLTPGRWQPWTPLGVWLGTHILFAGFPAKLWRERAIRHLGPEAVGLFATDGPGTAGSNGWLVTGDRTDTGYALIAGDPHRFIEDPGVYQQIHLCCPEFDVVGLAVPGVPGIAHFGHTGTVAWAITNAMADYQDLYRERLRRTGAGIEALGPDGAWHRAGRHTETVHIAGEPPIEIELMETPRGPVIAGGPEGLEAIAAGATPGHVDVSLAEGAPLAGDASVAVGASATTDAAAPADVASPAAGSGRRPGRAAEPGEAHGREGADGGDVPLGPAAPGDDSRTGAAGWSGDLASGAAEALALRYPPRVTEDLGFSALLPLLRSRTVADVDTALDAWTEPVNVVLAADTAGGTLHRVAGHVPRRAGANRLHPVPAWEPGHAWQGAHETPYARPATENGVAVMANARGLAAPLGVEFAPPHRATRIRALLDARPTWTADGMPAIHTDTHLGSAAPLLDHLAALTGLGPAAAALRDRLLAWDRRMAADSTDAAAYAAVRGAVVRHLAAHPVFAPLAEPPGLPGRPASLAGPRPARRPRPRTPPARRGPVRHRPRGGRPRRPGGGRRRTPHRSLVRHPPPGPLDGAAAGPPLRRRRRTRSRRRPRLRAVHLRRPRPHRPRRPRPGRALRLGPGRPRQQPLGGPVRRRRRTRRRPPPRPTPSVDRGRAGPGGHRLGPAHPRTRGRIREDRGIR